MHNRILQQPKQRSGKTCPYVLDAMNSINSLLFHVFPYDLIFYMYMVGSFYRDMNMGNLLYYLATEISHSSVE